MQKIPQQVHTVSETLTAAGEKTYLVGGCVRDLLRGTVPSDYDLTTSACPERVLALFGAAAHPTGLQHGTVTVSLGGLPMEITTMRCDGAYHDNRHPDAVTFTDRIELDLARRDFTVNAMALSADGVLIDPFGGQRDLEDGILRCVGKAETRFREDALRILRLLRFSAVIGFAIEEETAAAAHACRENLRSIACERVYAEMNKLLGGAEVTRVLLDYPDIFGIVLPEILPAVGFDQHNFHHRYDVWGHTARAVGAIEPSADLRWTMLFHDLGKPHCMTFDETGIGHFYGHTALSCGLAEDIMTRLHFENSLRDAVRAQLACFDDPLMPQRAALHKEMALRGRETVGKLLRTKRADSAAKGVPITESERAQWAETERIYEQLCAEKVCCRVSELALRGDEVRSLGFCGREIGAVLQKLLSEVAAEKLPNTKEALYSRAARLYRSGYARQKKT